MTAPLNIPKGSLGPFLALIVLSAAYIRFQKSSSRKPEGDSSHVGDRRRSTLSNLTGNDGGRIRPPFPPVIRDMLSRCHLAYLSTVDSSASSSHLSLMRFTYLTDETDSGELIIMSTNRRTKKFDMLRKQGGVALLVHDFGRGNSGDNAAGVYSITLNGECIIEEGERAEKFRKAHLEHNPQYPQFIVGEDIAILSVEVTFARICNINDQVQTWSVESGALS